MDLALLTPRPHPTPHPPMSKFQELHAFVTDLDAPAKRAWVEPRQPTVFVDNSGALHVGTTVIAGAYVWARY